MFAVVDGLSSRLGFFTDSAFDDSDPNDTAYVNGTGILPITVTAGVEEVSLEISTDTFRVGDPDLNRDGVVNWSDRLLAFQAFQNAGEIGASWYLPRLDRNLNGEIDSSDYTSYVSLFLEIGPCLADWNGDSIVDADDFDDFVFDYYNGFTDVDGDGYITSSDWALFEYYHNNGCE